MVKPLNSALMWFRRDLRITDNAALHRALTSATQVWCVFVFDTDILDGLPRADRRVEFIHGSLLELDAALARANPGIDVRLIVRHGKAIDEITALATRLQVDAVIASHDDDPAALARDATVRERLAADQRAFHTVKDHVVFERSELLTQAGAPYSVFTPYKKAWLNKVDAFYLQAYPVERHVGALAAAPAGLEVGIAPLAQFGFEPSNLSELPIPVGCSGAQEQLRDFLSRIDNYQETRDFPARRGPSYLSVHLRFGTISIRALAREAQRRAEAGSPGAATWLSELIWRDFYHQVLHHHPHVIDSAFKPAYDAIVWESGPTAEADFAAWCEGRTGYPLVDAAMAQINRTGYMHNRLRMVVASFLIKDLGIDWRWGERYFAVHLNDFDLAANNGGWQWAASSGCDAQPYFRIFNPISQSRKFDPDGAFIRRYLPQLAGLPAAALHEPGSAALADLDAAGIELGRDYPAPIVRHDQARQRTLQRYAVVKQR
ncbi:MAG: deoxyribodipyrimidine photo-lyase [Ideonella sp.]